MQIRVLLGLCTALILTVGAATDASATVVTSLYGDKDGFGIGATDGAAFVWTAVGSPDAGTITDTWVHGGQTWSHTYDLGGLSAVTGATLEIFTGGQGWFGVSSLFVDNTFVGFLTDGDGNDGGDGQNTAHLDIFDLTPFLGLLNGAETIRVETALGGDGWVVDYSELTVEGDVMPEPTTLGLLGFGLAALAARARRRKDA